MKKTLLLILALVAITASAEQRTLEEMRSLAVQALNQTGNTRLKARAASESLEVLKDMPQLSLMGYQDAGWAIVSKDDSFEGVLGYGDSPINLDNPSPEFIFLLNAFNHGMQTELQQPATMRKAPARRVSTELRKVDPLLKTNWAQGWPYNEKSPIVSGYASHCVCGCVATAFAQVLNFHKMPVKTYGKASYTWTYKNTEKGIDDTKLLTYDFDANPFDWENIVEVYSKGVSTKKQIDAVSNLVFACGVWANMAFAPDGSGSVMGTCATNMNKNCDDLRAIDYTNYSSQQNAKINIEAVAKELNSGRPVIFGGTDPTTQGGHCFVIDGANAQGYLHCNLGWGGDGNGYFKADDMAGYTIWQQIVAIVPGDYTKLYTPMEELTSKRISVDENSPATELKADTWYMMWNVGRETGLADLGKEFQVACSPKIPHDALAAFSAGQIVRLQPNADGTRYKIQTGTGFYLPSFAHNGTGKSNVTGTTYAITPITDETGTLHPDRFCLQNTNKVPMDCNGTNIVGWGSSMTKDPEGNAAWMFLPVTLSDAGALTLVSEISLPNDTIRLLQGESRPLNPQVLPANASIPYYRTVSKNSTYAFVENGEVVGSAKGTSTITLSAIDGSGVSATCTVYVGTSTKKTTVSSINNTLTYTLRNTGLTNGYLIATDTTTTYPQLRGITAQQSGMSLKDPQYWDEALIGDAYTQWQFVKSTEGDTYLYNVGMQQFLVPDEKSSCYIFSKQPQPISIALVGADDFGGDFTDCFYLNGGTEEGQRLMASTAYLNPAHMLTSGTASKKKQTVWEICALSGLSTKLPLLTQTDLDAMLSSEGIGMITTGSRQQATFDLQGRILTTANQRGIIIQNGKKIIR